MMRMFIDAGFLSCSTTRWRCRHRVCQSSVSLDSSAHSAGGLSIFSMLWRCWLGDRRASNSNNNNNNNNNYYYYYNKEDNVYGAVIVAKHSESSPGSYDECGTVPSGCRPSVFGSICLFVT